MKVLRTSETDTNKLQMGDVIRLKDGYTATCQAVTETGAIMLLDQYLDFDAPMNEKNTNRGGYEASDLRKWLQDQLDEFLPEDLEKRLKTFENGDLLRLPYYGEMFDHLDPEYVEPDGMVQWPLMKERKNRIAFHRSGDWDCGWLMNRRVQSAATFAYVYIGGIASYAGASDSVGVRPAFSLS